MWGARRECGGAWGSACWEDRRASSVEQRALGRSGAHTRYLGSGSDKVSASERRPGGHSRVLARAGAPLFSTSKPHTRPGSQPCPPSWPPSCGRPSRSSGSCDERERGMGAWRDKREASWPKSSSHTLLPLSIPTHSSDADRLAFAVHAWMLSQGYKLVAVGEAADGEWVGRERERGWGGGTHAAYPPCPPMPSLNLVTIPALSLSITQPSLRRTRRTRHPRAGTLAPTRARTLSGTRTRPPRGPPARRPW